MNQTRTDHAEAMATSYGFEEVAAEEKQPKVNEVFHKVADRYDLMNDLMSAGMHRLWKDALVSNLAPPRKDDSDWRGLDVAGGTGDVAFRIVEASKRNVPVTVLDINGSMLEVGKARAEKQGLNDLVDFVEANAEELPFSDGSFNAYTIAFGIRNVPDIKKALLEAYRVLKPGGKFLCLEFSDVDVPILDKIYDEWSMKVIPPIGRVVTGDGQPYQYLVESIRKFPDQQHFVSLISNAGFSRVSFRNFTGGIAALHIGWKL